MTNEIEKTDVEHVEVAVVTSNALESLERANVDLQISTAHKYPRDVTNKFIPLAIKLVSVDAETAEACIYRRPVGDGKFAEGESIRLAEIVAATYGNLRVRGIVTEMTPRYVKATGMAHDLESNFAASAEVVESTVTKYGQPYSERMRLVTAKVALSKAIRDAIFRVVPKSICKPIITKCREIIAGTQKPLNERRAAVSAWLAKLTIAPERVFAALEVSGIGAVGEEELLVLTGIRTALKDGEITLEEAFPEITNPTPAAAANQSGTAGLKSRAGKKTKSEPAPTDAPTAMRYSCEKCDREYDLLTDKGLCPGCLSGKIIDREQK